MAIYMIKHTKPFFGISKGVAGTHQFCSLVCHAVPTLKEDLLLPTPTVSNPPDHFKADRNPKTEIASYINNYQEELARSALITIFSYFESYIKDASSEIVQFHGGEDKLKKFSRRRATKFITVSDSEITAYKRKVQHENHFRATIDHSIADNLNIRRKIIHGMAE